MSRQLNVVMAQINLLVGDIAGNTDRIIRIAHEAVARFNADIVIFPELSLTSYPPEDLLMRPALQGRIDAALQTLCQECIPAALVIGHPQQDKSVLYNALSIIRNGDIVGRYYKQCLPNYQVFDEQRYFAAGDKPCVLAIKDVAVAFTICEDLWQTTPTRQASQSGAELLININASPFSKHKLEQRVELLARRARESGTPIVYVNLVGGQDELVFDGYSMVADAQGSVHVVGDGFSEDLALVQFDLTQGEPACPIFTENVAERHLPALEQRCYQAMVLGLQDYVTKNRFDSVILGLSGGIDSALTLAVAVDALGADKVSAVMMPFTYTSDLSVRLAKTQADRLGVNFSIIPIVKSYEAFMEALGPEFEGLPVDLTEQNIQARCRGVLLMAISNKKGALVLTTGNKSEIAVGYCTLYGDMAGGFGVLKDAGKMLVYALSAYRNQLAEQAGELPVIPRDVIDRPPSAELAPGQRDDDNLPPYEQLDQILELYVEQDRSADEIVAQGFDHDEVYRVIRLVDLNEYKRRQSAPGVRLTERGFGRDRRYPITHGWKAGN
ncbi:MAG: NAD+ synthase [Pseudohongiella sp.]|nr:NAD+ synthase [Pseudohongiella sp.]